jgi:cytochrome c553
MRSQFILSLLLAFVASGAWAGDIQAGKSKAASCAGCHGPQGISIIPGYPHLAGQKAGYLVASLKSFRSGDRANPIMGPMAQPLSDQDIDDLAAFYSGLEQCQ